MWWRARSSGFFFVVGLQGDASANLGPMFPAFCAGLSAALTLLIADAAAGTLAGVIAVLSLFALPGFVVLHRDSLYGPPLLTITLLMIAAMVHAPRFSMAYGTLGATGGLLVATDGIGLPLAAAAWALLQRARENGRWQRVALALLPVVAIYLVAHFAGGAWSRVVVIEWRGGLDRALRSAGAVLSDQIAPGIVNPALRFLVIADLALVIIAMIVVGWRKAGRTAVEGSALRAFYPVCGLVVISLSVGLIGQSLLVRDAREPEIASMIPIIAPILLTLVVSTAMLWKAIPSWGRVIVVVVWAGWLQAALRH